jgi:signal transduction histidine kinase
LTPRTEGRRGDPNEVVPETHRTQHLASALREGAAIVAGAVGGGAAMVFVTVRAGDPDSARLRAASGFANSQDARSAAEGLQPQVREAIASGAELAAEAIATLGPRAAGGLRITPLEFEGAVHGALVTGAPAAIDRAQGQAIRRMASELALRLDHDRLAQQVVSSDVQHAAPGNPDQNDDVLKLSEALFAQDIELLRTHEKLGTIEKLKNDFIEKMSRELRTPLNSIIEAIISVLAGENEALSDGAKASLRSALDEGTAFLRTLQNILDLWRIKQSELPLEIQDVNFREMVDEAIFSVQDVIGDRPVRTEQDLEQPFPKIRTDLTKLNQIMLLLLDNAAKFTTRGRIEISARVEDDRLTCEVRDTGIGICHDDQRFVFDEFYQVDEPASQKYAGAGLGLSLVRDLIVLMNGEISISSEVGAGTTVRFQIPVQVV